MSKQRVFTIHSVALSLVAGFEALIIGRYDSLFKDIEGAILAGNVDSAILLTMIAERITAIEEETNEELGKYLHSVYDYTFSYTIFEKSVRVGAMIHGYTPDWCKDGKNYLDRTLRNNNDLLNDLTGLLLSGQEDNVVLLGLLKDTIEKAKNKWLRLLRTEAEAAYSMGNRDALLALGYVYAVIVNPSPCVEICEEEVGSHRINLADGVIGIDLPPYHPNCKCVFMGYYWDSLD